MDYYRLLEVVKQNKLILDPLTKRIAQMLFYLNYRWLDKYIRRGRTTVATLILNACPEERNIYDEENIAGHLQHA